MVPLKFLLIGLMALWSPYGTANAKIVNCYIGTWAHYRPDDGAFQTPHIDPFLCTHISYAFFGIDEHTGAVKSLDTWLDFDLRNIEKMVALKETNPKLKIMLVVGGWNEGSKKYSDMANDPYKRRTFITSALKLIKENGFDGLDLDWEYPARRHSSPVNDKDNFVVLLKEIYETLHPMGLEFGIAVGASVHNIGTSYNIREIARNVDFINVMTYDFATPGNGVVGYNAPLNGQGLNNVKDGIRHWLKSGAPAYKLVMGVPFYGHTFRLAQPQQISLGSPTVGPGARGPFTQQEGFLGYNEICAIKGNWSHEWISESSVPILHNSQELISYDDASSIELKVDLCNSLNLAGVMIWSIETDDFHGKCGDGKFPLLNAINKRLQKPQDFNSRRANTRKSQPRRINKPKVNHVAKKLSTPPPPPSPSNDANDCKVNGLFPHKQYCNYFIHCDEGRAYQKQCPASLFFDPLIQTCNWPASVAPHAKRNCKVK